LGVNTAHVHENLARAFALLGRKQEARQQRAISRGIAGKRRFGLDLLHDAWQWLSGGSRAGR
jgi:hypothetical protein